MQYIIGAVGALLLLGGLGAAFLLGVRFERRRNVGSTWKSTPTKETTTSTVDETAAAQADATRQREESLRKDFEIISGYNLNKALERKKL